MDENIEEQELLSRALAKREARLKREEQEARPILEEYIRKNGWENASIVNRFVIKKGENYYVQTVNGIQEIQFDKHGNYFSIYPTKLNSWQEETEIQKLAREVNEKTQGINISGGKIGRISIGTISSGSRGVEINNLKVEKIEKGSNLTLTVPGAKLNVSALTGNIEFKISS